ncbi:hypothetical protein [Spirosoma koreense]
MQTTALRLGISWVLIGFLAVTQGCIGLLDPDNHNRGLIVSEYPTAVPTDKKSCFDPNSFDSRRQLPSSEIVIDSDSALHAYFDYARYGYTPQNFPADPCRNYQPEPIDFSKYILLGNYASAGCNVAFTRTVESDDHARQYVYTVRVRESGFCKRLTYSMNWVLVPKPPAGYRVAFLIR